MTRLTRSSAGVDPAAPVRMVHLGLGGFHRAHQAWYTQADPQWGIAAYTFRNTELPRLLTQQDGVYSLLVGGEDGVSAETVGSISRAHPGGDTRQFLADLASPEVAVVTLTVTEAAYRAPAPGEDSALSRLVAGLEHRFRTSGAPVSLVPCDNVPDNGAVLRAALRATAAHLGESFAVWAEDNVSVATTVVDRITPATTESDIEAARSTTGLLDLAPVVTESFTEWLISGQFPWGRPAWETAGARFVDDVGSYQQRKLWFLNGAHSLLAYVGLARGHETVRDAVHDDVLTGLLDSWWDVAARHTAVPAEDIDRYRARLLDRFAAPGIRHHLLQIASDGSQKIPARFLPVLRAERELGRLPEGAVTAIGAWIAHLARDDVRDARASELVPLAKSREPAGRVLSAIDGALGDDVELVATVDAEAQRLAAGVP